MSCSDSRYIEILYATHYDIADIKRLFDNNKYIFGFLPRSAIKQSICKGELIVARTDNKIIGFCRFHRRKDKQTTIYDLFVLTEYRKCGIGRQLIEVLRLPLQAKCPVDLESNAFYSALGFGLIRTEKGKNRDLNVWRLE